MHSIIDLLLVVRKTVTPGTKADKTKDQTSDRERNSDSLR